MLYLISCLISFLSLLTPCCNFCAGAGLDGAGGAGGADIGQSGTFRHTHQS